jgi:hypothetical protein
MTILKVETFIRLQVEHPCFLVSYKNKYNIYKCAFALIDQFDIINCLEQKSITHFALFHHNFTHVQKPYSQTLLGIKKFPYAIERFVGSKASNPC